MIRIHIFKYCTILLLINFAVSDLMYAQPEEWRSEVRRMFPAQVKNLWIHHLKGTIGGLHQADFILGTDGTHCKGLYVLYSSNLKFYFEGEDKNEHIQLMEQTRSGRITGYISGSYDGKHLYAIWTDIQKIQKIPVTGVLHENYSQDPINNCSVQESMTRFEGKIQNEWVKLFMLKNGDHYTLHWFVGNKQYTDECRMAENSSFCAITNNCPILHNKHLYIPKDDPADRSDLQITENSQVYKMSNKINLPFECFEFADFTTRMELIKPNPGNPKFNQWLEQKFRFWFNENHRMKEQKPDYEYAVTDRWKHNIYGWVDIHFFNKELISGIIYRQNSRENQIQKQAFIYDLSVGKELILKDVIDKKFNIDDYLTKVITARKKELSLSPGIRKWVDSQLFTHCTLKLSGIICSTDFHPLYGELEIRISYDDLKSEINQKSLLKELNLE